MTLLQSPLGSTTPGSPAPAPPELVELAARTDALLIEVLGREYDRWTDLDPEFHAPLSSLLRLVVEGGKRLRPAFCYWGFVAAGGDPAHPQRRARVDRVGGAFELLHAFALIHDDVMDDADRRRGAPTAHVEYGRYHEAGDWRGEGRRFGESMAILIGDLAHVYADGLFESAGAGPDAARVWRELQTELMMGQYLDVLGTARGDRSPRRASLIAQLKSGRYTIERPLEIGAALVAAPADLQAALQAYGRPLGEAFQLRDDLLGAFGDTATVGKPVGPDLREGKPTPLLAYAVDHASATQRRVLDRVGSSGLTDREIADLQIVLVDTGARQWLEERIDALATDARRALDAAPIPPVAHDGLRDLADFIVAREY